jgi:hypothetical protein
LYEQYFNNLYATPGKREVYRIKEKTMKKNLVWSLLVGLLLILSTSTNLMAKSDEGLDQPEVRIPIAYPGVVIDIIDIEIPDDRTPLVTFSIKNENGLPLDMDGVFTEGVVDIRFMLTFIPIGEEQKVNYHDSTRDRGGEYTTIEQGLYTYKFTTVLPEDWQQDATHTLAGVALRDLRGDPYNGDRHSGNDLYDFVPSGAGMPMPRDVVSTATCNRCHGELAEHGGRYKEVAVCGQRHNPAFDVDREKDPDESVSLNAMIHRVHSGNDAGTEMHYPAIINDCEVCHTGGTPAADFPMVAGPSPTPVCDGSGLGMTTIEWVYSGNVEVRLDSADGKLFAGGGPVGSAETGKWVDDGRKFFLVDAANGDAVQELAVNTTVFGCNGAAPGTFRGEAAMQHTRWMTRPSRLVCGSCHVNIDFENGEGHLAQSNDDNCANCHEPDSGEEFDRSVAGAHTVHYKSTVLDGVLVTVLEIDDTYPGGNPEVIFSLTDKNGPLDPAVLNRLRFTIAGPNEDFAYYVQEDVLAGMRPVGTNWAYRFDTEIPRDAMGSYSFGLEGRIANVMVDDEDMEDQIQNFILPIAVTDDMPMARDQIVKDGVCEDCHSNLTLHGTNRHDASGYCQTCHRADLTDEAVRLEGEPESVHFKYMIHKIHRGADLERDYIVYGYRSSLHDHYNDIHFPGDVSNCETCHEEDTYTLPLPEGRLDTIAPGDFWSPMKPIAAACLSCHDGMPAAAHAANNTSEFGEACVACHGEDSTFSVENVHNR